MYSCTANNRYYSNICIKQVFKQVKITMKIITSKKQLKKPCRDVSLKQGRLIGDKLVKALKQNSDRWIGLAANQIGYNARVLAMYLTETTDEDIVIFVNPTIISHSGNIRFIESCVSFPGHNVLTERYQQININDDFNGDTSFYSPQPVGDSPERRIYTSECVCIQHELDHLDGITMFDRRVILTPHTSDKKIGRNSPCICGSGLKYKHCCLSG